MKFKIRKITYNNGGILYYAMVKKQFWGWYYIKEVPLKFKLTKNKDFAFIHSERKAREIINNYKNKRLPIIEDILID